ncbi:hypothetical protein CBA19CS11_30455 [Caballeronia novacaledonica]|uniref:hypothetical protein n=1 Tax=Caballeronia novacaledonica TaxID=1544861 RepID=UPI001EE28A3A|nr:hypothetical protein [Caballeronia novacaledonica]GJH13251.1 hypothetical protein CBA19CS11_30455 [Caballeronia novacaledonica]
MCKAMQRAISHSPRSMTMVGVCLHLFPTMIAAAYPWYLATFYQLLHSKSVASAFFALCLALAVPGTAFISLHSLARIQPMLSEALILLRLTYITFISPSLYVLVGVLLYLMKFDGRDLQVWIAMWLILLITAWLTCVIRRGEVLSPLASESTRTVRLIHGVVASIVLVVFVFAHLINHTFGLFGVEVHEAIMIHLRHLYRSPFVEPVILVLIIFQIVSGLVLVEAKIRTIQSMFDALQTASGLYLAVFITSHLTAVFVLGRHAGVETDFKWATALPAGLLADPWAVRLIPHYFLGIWLLLIHVACGGRIVLLAHRVKPRAADTVCGLLIVASTLWTAVILAGVVGVRV